MSERQLKKRFTVSNIDIIEKLLAEKRDTIAVLGHYNNWEYLCALPFYTKYKTVSYINHCKINTSIVL